MYRAPQPSRPAQFLPLLCTAWLLLSQPEVSIAEEPVAKDLQPSAVVERLLSKAHADLAAGEPQIAESQVRRALLEAWHLRGLLAVAAGDLTTARNALERAASAAAVDILAPRVDLALTQYQLGETDPALQELRALTRQFRSEPKAWRSLMGTLIAENRREEVGEQLADLRLVLPEVANELETSLAKLEDSESEAWRPQIDLHRLGPKENHQTLQAQITGLVAQAEQTLETVTRHRATQVDLEALLKGASESLSDAVQAIERGQLREAEALLRRAQKQGHDSLTATNLLSLVRGAQGDGVQARLALAQLASQSGSPKAALDLLAEARRRAPSSEEVLAAEARVAMSVGLDATALQALEPLAGISPEVAEYAYRLGIIRARLGLMTESVEALQRSVELAPQETPYLFALAEALNREKRFDEAERLLNQVLETNPGDIPALAALALAEEGLDKLDDAEGHAQDVLTRQPEHAGAHLVMGMVRMKQQRYAEARAALEQVVAGRHPDVAKAHYQLSLACMRLGDRESARRHQELYRQAQARVEGAVTELTLESSTSALTLENPE